MQCAPKTNQPCLSGYCTSNRWRICRIHTLPLSFDSLVYFRRQPHLTSNPVFHPFLNITPVPPYLTHMTVWISITRCACWTSLTEDKVTHPQHPQQSTDSQNRGNQLPHSPETASPTHMVPYQRQLTGEYQNRQRYELPKRKREISRWRDMIRQSHIP